MNFPQSKRSKSEIFQQLTAFKSKDPSTYDGKAFSYVFHLNDEVLQISEEAFRMFMSANGIAPTTFQSLKNMENEVVSMMCELLNGGKDAVGSMTSGGTESLLLAVKTMRDYARKHRPEVKNPEIIVPVSMHPSFHKGGYYFDVKIVSVGTRKDNFEANVQDMEAAVNPNTIGIACSTPSYPQGVVDPVAQIGEIAERHNLLFHVDACMGGLTLPFIEKLGYDVPVFDFRVPAVTSMSIDLHKYGYTAKGASVLLWRNAALRRHQFFAFNEWPGYTLVNPTMLSTKSGGPVAAAWAVMNFLGREGYQEITKATKDAVEKLKTEIPKIEGLYVLGNPVSTLIAFASKQHNIYEIGDELTEMGWTTSPQVACEHAPANIHLTVTFGNIVQIDNFLADLSKAVKKVSQFRVGKLLENATTATLKTLANNVSEQNLDKILDMVGAKKAGDVPKRLALISSLLETLPRDVSKNMLIDYFSSLFTVPDTSK